MIQLLFSIFLVVITGPLIIFLLAFNNNKL
uniref:Photosystem II protein n=1 Tax=Halimeda discoidea TaxID=118222 RepID=A0A1C9JBB3_9CHLO|nr:photosystem II protein [Halimeda discoidea]